MKVIILHHDLEWAEEQFYREFKKRDVSVSLKDVRETSVQEIVSESPDLVLNRVYASVANRDYLAIQKTLELLKKIEEQNIMCLNSYHATRADYDKLLAIQERAKAGFLTPKTVLFETSEQASNFADEVGFPMIIKRNTGGRGVDLHRVENKEELIKVIQNIQRLADQYVLSGGKYILQEFLRSNATHDMRLGVLDGEFILHYGRTLIKSPGSKDNWLASVANGSEIIQFEEPNEKLKKLAIDCTNAIKAVYNELDVAITPIGPVIIEDNPTPNYMYDPIRPEVTAAEKKSISKVIDAFIAYFNNFNEATQVLVAKNK